MYFSEVRNGKIFLDFCRSRAVSTCKERAPRKSCFEHNTHVTDYLMRLHPRRTARQFQFRRASFFQRLRNFGPSGSVVASLSCDFSVAAFDPRPITFHPVTVVSSLVVTQSERNSYKSLKVLKPDYSTHTHILYNITSQFKVLQKQSKEP